MRHLESCVRRAIDVREKREEYNDEYPFHCEMCEGWGGTIEVIDPSLALASEVGETEANIDNCEFCINEGSCPRCGSSYDPNEDSEDYDEECSFCGFVLGVTEGKPYPHECLCGQLDFNNV